jgi:hypothetical protein
LFGMADSHNDINMVQRFSPVLSRLVEGKAPMMSYEINGNAYKKQY